jgi:hypothetical protein
MLYENGALVEFQTSTGSNGKASWEIPLYQDLTPEAAIQRFGYETIMASLEEQLQSKPQEIKA